MKVSELALRQAGADAVRRGHPWVWRSALAAKTPPTVETGAEVQLVDERREAIGRAYYDPTSPIAARVWSLGRRPIDDALVSERIASALALRSWIIDAETTAYRLVHGEGDRMPGFVVDRYAHIAVLRVDGGAAEVHAERVARLLRTPLEAIGVQALIERSTEKGQAPKATPRFGQPPPATIEVR